MIIAVDGPTASGKGTIAKALAAHFNLPHLDTGLLYRAVGQQVALTGGNPDDPAHAAAACAFPESLLADPELRSEASGSLASRVSVHPQVRAALYERQRKFATQPGGAVLDGRDIGTVIAPEAHPKLFITASLNARAQRRHAEMQAAGRPTTLAEITADLTARDHRDTARSAAPLLAATDAITLDTSNLTRDQAIAAATALCERAPPALTLHDFTPALAQHFHDINVEWITAMFSLEPADREVLEHPEAAIIQPGGAILFVEAQGLGIVGTAALRKTGRKTGETAFELTKMGVRETARGLKAGEFLLAAAIERAAMLGADPLYLLTNHKCEAAIHLYEKLGFQHDAEIMAQYAARYQRCDVAMRYRAGSTPARAI